MDIKKALEFINKYTTEPEVVKEITQELTDHLHGLAEQMSNDKACIRELSDALKELLTEIDPITLTGAIEEREYRIKFHLLLKKYSL